MNNLGTPNPNVTVRKKRSAAAVKPKRKKRLAQKDPKRKKFGVSKTPTYSAPKAPAATSSNFFGSDLGDMQVGPRRSRTTTKRTTKAQILSQIRSHNKAFAIKGMTGTAANLKAKLNKKRSIVRGARPQALAGMAYPRTAGMAYPRTAGHRGRGCGCR